MTMIKQYPKRIIAVAVAIMLLLGTLFTGAVSASAAEPNYATGLTKAVSKADDLFNGVGSYKKVTDIATGGVKLEYVSNSGYSPFSPKQNLGNFDTMKGFTLQFANYTELETSSSIGGYGIIAIVLVGQTGNDRTKIVRTGVPFLQLDTNAGTLKLGHGISESMQQHAEYDETIIDHPVLKYANITGKPFSITIANDGNGNFRVSVDVDGTIVTGKMTRSYISAQTYHPSSAATFISVGSQDSNNTHKYSLNFYGWKMLDDSYVLPEITPPILSSKVKNVATTATNGYTGKNKRVTDIAYGGVLYSVPSSAAYDPYIHNVNIGNVLTKNFKLQFNNYVSTSTNTSGWGYRTFAIGLVPEAGEGNAVKLFKDGTSGLLFDTVNGKVDLVEGNAVTANDRVSTICNIIPANDALKYENITGKAFTVEWINGKTDVTIRVTVENGDNDAVVTGKLPNATYRSVTRPITGTSGYFTVTGMDNSEGDNPWSIEYYGFNELGLTPSYPNLTNGVQNIATKALDATTFNKSNNIDGGGVKYSVNDSSSYTPYIHNVNVGNILNKNYRLYFSDYESTATNASVYGYRNFAIGLVRTASAQDQYRKLYKGGVMGLGFDTVNGKLNLVRGTAYQGNSDMEVVHNIITNDALKYENITGKAFTVDWLHGDTNITIKVNITNDDGTVTTLKGTLPVATYTGTSPAGATYPLNTGTGYFSVTGIEHARGTNPFSIEYYGFTDLGKTPSAEGLTEGLTDIATVAKDIEQTRKDLNDRSDLVGGGVYISWANRGDGIAGGGNSGYGPYRYNVNMGNFPGIGIRMQFADYKIDPSTASTAPGYGQIAICLSTTTGNDGTKIKQNTPVLQIDTVNGKLLLGRAQDASCGATKDLEVVQTIIDTTDTLKYANFSGKPFNVIIQKHENETDYLVTIDVNGAKVSGKLDKANMATFTNDPARHLTTYMSIGGTRNNTENKWSIEYYGYESMKIQVPVIDVSQLTETSSITTDSNASDRSTQNKKLENIAGGGTRITFLNSISGYFPYAYSINLGKFPGDDGFKLQFSNYVNNATKTAENERYYGQIVIVLTNSTGNDRFKIKKDVPFLQIDTVNGKLYLRHCLDDKFGTEKGFTTDQEILTSDLLKAKNFQHKAFSLTFKNSTTSEGDVDITIEVGGDGNTVKGETVTAVLDMDIFNNITYHAGTSTFISIGGLDNNSSILNPFSLEFYGYQNFGVRREDVLVKATDVAEVNTAIAALPESATEADAEAILAAKAKYDSLDVTAQAQVTGADKLATLVSELNALRNASKIKPTSTYIAREADDSLDYVEFGNPGARTLFSEATDNGFKIKWRGASTGVSGHETLLSQSIYGAYALDGMRVHIDDYTFDATKGSDFWVQFTSGDYDEYWNSTGDTADRMIAVRLACRRADLKLTALALLTPGSQAIQSFCSVTTSRIKTLSLSGENRQTAITSATSL